MKLPVHLENANEWLLVGPMGPLVPPKLASLPTLAVDGGLNFCERFDLWLGDGDSGSPPSESSHVHLYPQEKDRSDLSLSLGLFGGKKGLDLHFWGFLGGRRDHEWITIGETLSFLDTSSASKATFYNGEGKVELYCMAGGLWNFQHQGVFSLAGLKRGQFRITGQCKYEISEWTEINALSSHGLSNLGLGDFQLECESPMILFLAQEKR